jgi:hypothetical protein
MVPWIKNLGGPVPPVPMVVAPMPLSPEGVKLNIQANSTCMEESISKYVTTDNSYRKFLVVADQMGS